MKKHKKKGRKNTNKDIVKDNTGIDNSKQRKSLYYLLFKGGLWQ